MDNKSQKLLILFLGILAFSIALTFWRTMILKDFQVVQSEEEITGEE